MSSVGKCADTTRAENNISTRLIQFILHNQAMPMKEWFRRLEPVQLYFVLGLTILFFITELVVSHVTHALTLLMDSYHTLCNIFALAACMITVKYGNSAPKIAPCKNLSASEENAVVSEEESAAARDDNEKSAINSHSALQETKLKNTFGWARVDVVGMLMCCVFLASLSFSIFVEALQTLVHIDHHDEMHQPIGVLGIGIVGLFLNGFCYMTIGGYTFHQGSFLYISSTGCVVLNRVVTNDSVRRGERRLSRTRTVPSPGYRQRQGFKEMLRDIIGCIFVIACALLVHFNETNIAKFIDPVLSVVSAASLMLLSYPYMKESCLILLQTIPDTVNIDSLRSQLLEHFPDIINVHDLHIWQLTATKVISTAHIIFQNPTVYSKIKDSVTEFFTEHGITQVTIQPEFFTKVVPNFTGSTCLMQCLNEDCKTSHCCPDFEIKDRSLVNRKWRSLSNESLQDVSTVDLKSIKMDTSELPILEIHRAGRDLFDTNSGEIATEQINRGELYNSTNNVQVAIEQIHEKDSQKKCENLHCCDTTQSVTVKD